MKKLILFLALIFVVNIYSQEEVDIGTPTNQVFQVGQNLQGTIQNSVNEATGKVTLSAPLASVAASSVSYGVNLFYNGEVAFKNGQQTNKYNPTSVVGVGWSVSASKIVVDNKNTGTRDDDEFYLLDGATNTKLICIDKNQTGVEEIWEFQMEKYAPWIIKYYKSRIFFEFDYWTIVKDDGQSYYFGSDNVTSKSRESVIAWGNWIGSSVQPGGTQHTIVWNLSKIQDQWENTLNFEYELAEVVQSGSSKQTEASYLKKITSSNGSNIRLTYAPKTLDEFYEPHQEASEPDAYQERYEKKYLQSVSSYNTANQLVSAYNIGYTLNGSGLNTKRYLTSLTQTVYNNGLNETLPAQIFEYHYTGTFKGGIKKITYPTGGSVTYNYNNKLLFNNTANKYASAITWPSDYVVHSRVVKDNYTLYVLKTTNPVSGNKHRFKMFRLFWNGDAWEHNEFTFPYLIDDHAAERLKDFYVVLEKDFYGFAYDTGVNANLYLFHLNDDGKTWNEYTTTDKPIGGYPYFVSGDGFVGLGSRDSGYLYTYVWNGSSWNNKIINQGAGEYFMAATNNYIVSLNERDSSNSVDMITGLTHSDYYYIHYLDASKNWQTKSWSAAADPYINDVFITASSPGYASFYPDNSIIGFVAKDNPELFLRWDTNYNLTNVDNVLGSYNDLSPMQPIANSMFTLHAHGLSTPYISARFNGINWKIATPTAQTTNYTRLQFGMDFFSYANSIRIGSAPRSHDSKIYNYNPNTNSWTSEILYAPNDYYDNSYNAINLDFMVVGKKFFNKSNQGVPPLFNEMGSLNEDNMFAYSDGLNHTYVQHLTHGKFYYTDKKDGLLKLITLNDRIFYKHQIATPYGNESQKFGGYHPFMSPNALSLFFTGIGYPFQLPYVYLYKTIDDQLNNAVYDIVVNHIDINDDNGSLSKVQYTYNKPKPTPDNSSTFYGEVIVENKGLGTGSIGKIVKIFNDGSTDLAMVGLPLEVFTIDANNTVVKKNTTTWQKFTKAAFNGIFNIGQSYYVRATKEKEELFFNGSPNLVSETTHTYNTLGLKTASTATDSKGIAVKQEITYAYQQYSFVNDKNMLVFPYHTISKINNVTTSVEQSKWINDNGKVYMNENWSGPTTSNLRLSSQISKVEAATGNGLENNNGKGLYNSVLFGYNNLFEVATISNAKYQDVVSQLDVTYLQLQSLTSANLKTELLKLYDRLPNASISLSFYDSNGRVTSRINNRKEESFVFYDTLGRQDYITDAQGNVLEKKNYHFSD